MGIFMIFINRPFQENKNTLFNKNISLLVVLGLWDCLDRTYFAETKNWKYYSKIIFKCVNSAVGPIFNEKVVEKWNLWIYEQCTDTLFTVEKSTSAATKKKNGWNALKVKRGRNKPNPNLPLYP